MYINQELFRLFTTGASKLTKFMVVTGYRSEAPPPVESQGPLPRKSVVAVVAVAVVYLHDITTYINISIS